VNGTEGKSITSQAVSIEEAWLSLNEIELIQFKVPETIIENVVTFPYARPIEGKNALIIQLDQPLPRHYALAWICDGKQVAEGRSFIPRKTDIGKILGIKIRDRIRFRMIVVHELPPVTPSQPTIADVKLKLECTDESRAPYTVNIQGQYSGGTEGEFVI
jgi:hypothetical protein